MRHLTDGTLRRLVDEPAGVADADRKHVAGCPVCLSELAAARDDAAAVNAALDLELTTDVDEGWRRLSRSVGASRRRPGMRAALARWWRAAPRRPVIAGAVAVVLLTGASAAAAANWLQIFRTEQVAPIVAPDAELITLPELSDFGELEIIEEIDVRPVADAAAAEQASGLSVPRVGELPRGVTGEPRYLVAGQTSALFTFSAEKAGQFSAAAGATLPPPPPGLDGSRFRLAAGPGLAVVWSDGRPAPSMVVARVVAPTVYSEGIPFETARDYLLSLPVLPDNVAAQLRGFTGDGTTLPLFLSTDDTTSFATDVGGRPATVFTRLGGVFAAVVWVQDTVVTAVAGSLSADEVLSVARGLRWGR